QMLEDNLLTAKAWQIRENFKYLYSVQLPAEDINYIESDGNYCLFHTDEKVYKNRSTIKQIMEMLPGNTFVQVHRAYVVNKTKIEKFNPKNVIVQNTEVPVSRNYGHIIP
ncbi:MAG: LytTR family DNA-binding domain-containing protein, partial [Edaphocola sp.]